MKSCAISSAIDPKTKSNQGDVWHLSAVFYKHALCVDYSSIQVSELAWSMAELSIIPWWQLLIQYLTPHSYLQFIKANPTFMCMPVTFFFFFHLFIFVGKLFCRVGLVHLCSTLLKIIWIPCIAAVLAVSFEEIKEKYVISMRYVDWYTLLGGCSW